MSFTEYETILILETGTISGCRPYLIDIPDMATNTRQRLILEDLGCIVLRPSNGYPLSLKHRRQLPASSIIQCDLGAQTFIQPQVQRPAFLLHPEVSDH
jgi:hypothetical protein